MLYEYPGLSFRMVAEAFPAVIFLDSAYDFALMMLYPPLSPVVWLPILPSCTAQIICIYHIHAFTHNYNIDSSRGRYLYLWGETMPLSKSFSDQTIIP